MNRIKYSFAVLLALILTGCNNMLSEEELDIFEETGLLHEKKPAVEITELNFTPDYKKFTVATRILKDFGPYQLADSTTIRIQVKESVNGISQHLMLPELTAARNIEEVEIAASGIKMHVLVDLTLPQEAIDRQHQAVADIQTCFSHDNLYVSFFYGDTITAPVKVTDYVMSHYFHREEADHKFLYRAILQKKHEMQEGQQPWAGSNGKLLVIFSDEQVYLNDDLPMDPRHFELQEEMLRRDNSNVMTFYVSMNNNQEPGDEHPAGILKILCQNSGGLFQPDFDWITIKKAVFNKFGMDINSYEFDFVNPDYKVYRDDHHVLTLNFYNKANNNLVASTSTQIHKGSIYEPIIVNGHNIWYVILQGVLLGLILFVIIYLVFQYLIPYIRYRIFLSRHVITYRGPLMISGNRMVSQSCYLCKAPFVEGDRLVVKCSHTMHKSCWDENDYHCPEYGLQCTQGNHFYNISRLHDTRNASFLMPWLLVAILAATLAWCVFMIWAHYSSTRILEGLLRALHIISSDNAQSYINEYSEHEKQLPSFGLFIGFFLTMGFSYLAMYCRSVRKKWLSIIKRALFAGVMSMIVYIIFVAIEAIFDINSFTFLIEWIPWTLSAFFITWAATHKTRIHLKKRKLLLATGFALISMYLWDFLILDSRLDFRILLLLSNIIYAIGLAICTAKPVSRSKRYFLRVEGPVKTMEIALYKWFDAEPHQNVLIGKSVDCHLQLTWDLTGYIAPQHAEISKDQDALYLIPLEEGVYTNGKPMKVGKKIRLYQDESFVIGNTTLTYIEKDVK